MTDMLYAHNIDHAYIAGQDYGALYMSRRRDANFAGAVRHGDKIHAFRDHLGIAPLYYRYTDDGVQFSGQLTNLIQATDTLNIKGIRAYTQLGTTRLYPLFDQIHIVPPSMVITIDPATQTTEPVYRYDLKPTPISMTQGWETLVEQYKQLMLDALKSQLNADTVGLYLSGGIDSAVIGVLLQELGVEVRGYTSGAWGESSSDVVFAKKNADILKIEHHELHYLETDEYDSAMMDLPMRFNVPHGTPTGLGVTKLWEHTSIGDQKQLFFGQNLDTIMACVQAQSLSYFLTPLPAGIRQRLHPALKHRTAVQNYIALGRGYEDDLSQLHVPLAPDKLNRLQRIIHAGMFMGQTPSSSEVFTQPSFMTGQSIVNPYHHIDLVEFVMGLPLNRRFTLNDGSRWFPAFEKHLMQKLAERYLPPEIVKRKKAFIVSFDRDERSRALYDNLLHEIMDVPLTNPNERFAGEILRRWLKRVGHQVE